MPKKTAPQHKKAPSITLENELALAQEVSEKYSDKNRHGTQEYTLTPSIDYVNYLISTNSTQRFMISGYFTDEERKAVEKKYHIALSLVETVFRRQSDEKSSKPNPKKAPEPSPKEKHTQAFFQQAKAKNAEDHTTAHTIQKKQR